MPEAEAQSGRKRPDKAVKNHTDDGETGCPDKPKEVGGRDGPDPTRFGDWEKGGRCIDF